MRCSNTHLRTNPCIDRRRMQPVHCTLTGAQPAEPERYCEALEEYLCWALLLPGFAADESCIEMDGLTQHVTEARGQLEKAAY